MAKTPGSRFINERFNEGGSADKLAAYRFCGLILFGDEAKSLVNKRDSENLSAALVVSR
jgi:hypothetical protein